MNDSSAIDAFSFIPSPWVDPRMGTWANDLEERLVALSLEHGFQPSHSTKRILELVCPDRRQIVYVNRKRLQAQVIAVIVPPWSVLEKFHPLPGVAVPSVYFHSSNMQAFPQRQHGGEGDIPYGYSIVCADLTSFLRLLDTV